MLLFPTANEPRFETSVLRAWRDQLAAAARTPELAQEVGRHGDLLLPRFAAWYERLQRSPRRVRRALQSRLKQSLAGVALLLALGHAPALAATIPVRGSCTLANAITAANLDTPTGGCPAGDGDDTIVLPSNSILMLTSALPVIASKVTIAGRGSVIRRDPDAPPFRIMEVADQGDLALEAVTLAGGLDVESFDGGGGVLNNGTLTITNSRVSENTAHASGGGVSNLGSLTITNSRITGNTAHDNGGGVANFGTMTLSNSRIAGNTSAEGGGVWSDNGTLTITNSRVSGNTSTARAGGGIGNFRGTVTLTDSTVSGNTAHTDGGGVANIGGEVTLISSTVSGNTATTGDGGGVLNAPYTYCYNYCDFTRATATFTNSTISKNRAHLAGGGVANVGSTVTLVSSTVSGNTATTGAGGGVSNTAFQYCDGPCYDVTATATFTQSLITGNTALTGHEVSNDDILVADDHNLFGHKRLSTASAITGFTPGSSDITATGDGTEPTRLGRILDPGLRYNGGLTQTHALRGDSPAVDAIPISSCSVATDQRGIVRPQGAGCDIGAYESVPP